MAFRNRLSSDEQKLSNNSPAYQVGSVIPYFASANNSYDATHVGSYEAFDASFNVPAPYNSFSSQRLSGASLPRNIASKKAKSGLQFSFNPDDHFEPARPLFGGLSPSYDNPLLHDDLLIENNHENDEIQAAERGLEEKHEIFVDTLEADQQKPQQSLFDEEKEEASLSQERTNNNLIFNQLIIDAAKLAQSLLAKLDLSEKKKKGYESVYNALDKVIKQQPVTDEDKEAIQNAADHFVGVRIGHEAAGSLLIVSGLLFLGVCATFAATVTLPICGIILGAAIMLLGSSMSISFAASGVSLFKSKPKLDLVQSLDNLHEKLAP